MMINLNVDLGQLIVASLVGLLGVIGWFIKRDIAIFGKRLDKHEDILFTMSQCVATAVGKVDILTRILDIYNGNGKERK